MFVHIIRFCLLSLCLPVFVQAQSPQTRIIDPQSTQVQLQVDGLDRHFIVHVPPAYASDPQANFPLVFMFHGGGGSGKKFFNESQWKEVGDQEGVITVFPTGVMTCIIKDGKPTPKVYWMTEGKLAKLCPGETPRDDVTFVREMLDYLHAEYRVDKQRIYASGFSNGCGFILSKLMVEMPTTFAAFGGVGSLNHSALSPINQAAPLLVMIGDKDDHFTVPAGANPLPLTEAGVEANSFLKDMQGILLTALQLSPAYQVRERPKYLAYRFTQATGPGAPELRFAIMANMGHVFPKGKPTQNGIVAAEVIWDFFKIHHR